MAAQTIARKQTPEIGIVGGGPAGLVLAIALARRGIPTKVFERDIHPELAPRFNPDRSYTIDITGHGLRALRHIDAVDKFDERVNRFKGIRILDRVTEEWEEPGWTGSRGDIMRTLMALVGEKYQDCIEFEFECHINTIDVHAGTLNYTSRSGETMTRQFDLIVGADGAGSVVRNAMLEQIPGFKVKTKSFPNHVTMLELDRVGEQLDKHYLHLMSISPFCVAGAIRGDAGADSVRWFCCVGTKEKKTYASVEEAVNFLRKGCPRILELTSMEKIAEFAQRTCYNIGKTLSCEQLYGGKSVLIGDAAAPFPPIGQGLNAALESAMMLDLCFAQVEPNRAGLRAAVMSYDARWKPEADAVAWVAERHLFENRFQFLRARISYTLGLSVVGETKRSDISYSEVKRKAESLWPLWSI